DSSLSIAVDHDSCILCDRCIRGCDEVRNNFVLGRMGKGYAADIAFDLNSPMGDSTCISCGECMVSCPTGALTNTSVVGTAIPIDASVDLSYENPVAELGPGDLFGEMTCMNFYPRSATVRAESDVVAYEMLRNVLDIMLKNKSFRAQVDQNYRKRALENHLRGVPMFADLSADFIEHLKESVELLRFAPGQVIARQGDAADSFYLVRIGFVKISENYPGGEL